MTDEKPARRFGAVVRRLRQSRGWSQDEFAHQCGLHRSYMGAIERGQKVPTITTAQKIAGALGLSLSLLFAEVERCEP
ncbi:MAG TPA: helix-turn-helix transcriptional regulator [Chloroflexota bacterium]|nr:helix-turn-helix transcriptional regulator [Chloroflexota bacterium]